MQSRFLHTNFNVLDLEKSIRFYREALGLEEVRRIEAPDVSFIIVFLGDGRTEYNLELTWMRDRKVPYDLGDNEFHIAFRVPDKKPLMSFTRAWGASALRTMPWVFISSMTLTATGLKFSAQTEQAEPAFTPRAGSACTLSPPSINKKILNYIWRESLKKLPKQLRIEKQEAENTISIK